MLNTSEKIELVAEALVNIQSKMSNIVADATNPFFNNAKYAKLDALLDVVRPICTEMGCALVQLPGMLGDKRVLRTILMHKSGQWIGDCMELIIPKSNMQDYGSALTYARRYSVEGIAGITKTEDDDANKATEAAKKAQEAARKAAAQKPVAPASGARIVPPAPRPPVAARPAGPTQTTVNTTTGKITAPAVKNYAPQTQTQAEAQQRRTT